MVLAAAAIIEQSCADGTHASGVQHPRGVRT